MYYATFDSREEVIYNGQEATIGAIDLWRFNTKKERDEFVQESQYAEEISASDARKYHKDQFRYWRR